jgi:hypothetical protein
MEILLYFPTGQLDDEILRRAVDAMNPWILGGTPELWFNKWIGSVTIPMIDANTWNGPLSSVNTGRAIKPTEAAEEGGVRF